MMNLKSPKFKQVNKKVKNYKQKNTQTTMIGGDLELIRINPT